MKNDKDRIKAIRKLARRGARIVVGDERMDYQPLCESLSRRVASRTVAILFKPGMTFGVLSDRERMHAWFAAKDMARECLCAPIVWHPARTIGAMRTLNLYAFAVDAAAEQIRNMARLLA